MNAVDHNSQSIEVGTRVQFRSGEWNMVSGVVVRLIDDEGPGRESGLTGQVVVTAGGEEESFPTYAAENLDVCYDLETLLGEASLGVHDDL
jgi:hypothetical protein